MTLAKGANGSDVKDVQQKLKTLGYDVKVDGSFGADTVSAVKAFQKAQGMSNANGMVTNATLANMNKEAATIKNG